MSNHQPLNIKITISAPIQDVWNAWTIPEQFKQWYMPAPFSVSDCQLDLKVGGKISVDTKAPDGTVTPLSGEFLVIQQPNKLVMTNSPLDKDGHKLFEIKHTLLLSEENGQTMLDLTSEVLNAGPEAEPFLSGMEQGLVQALDQMTSLVTK